MHIRKITCFALILSMSSAVFAQEKVDLSTVEKIKTEERNRSKIMDIAFHLTDGSGSRLTISPGFTRAATYALDKLKEWGLSNVKLDSWGEFGKGWEPQKSYVAMTAPYYKALIAIPKAWTSGTNGLQNAEVIVISAKDSVDLQRYQGKLAGKVI